MLARGQADGSRGALAELQETPDLIAEFGKRLVVGLGRTTTRSAVRRSAACALVDHDGLRLAFLYRNTIRAAIPPPETRLQRMFSSMFARFFFDRSKARAATPGKSDRRPLGDFTT